MAISNIVIHEIDDAYKKLDEQNIRYTNVIKTVSDDILQFNDCLIPVAYYDSAKKILTIVKREIEVVEIIEEEVEEE